MPKRTVSDWQDRIIKAELYRDNSNYGDSQAWARFRDYYRGRFGEGGELTDNLTYNITYPFGQVLISSVYYQNPGLLISPRKPGFEIAAKANESIGQWLMQEMEIKKVYRRFVLNAFLCGRGIIKIGYEGEFTLAERDTISQLLGVDADDADDAEPLIGGKGMPWIRSIDPDMFLVPFGVLDIDDAEWVDHIVLRELENVKASKVYRNIKDLEGDHVARILQNPNKQKLYQELMGEEEYIELHEIRNAKDKELLTLTWDQDKFLRGPIDDVLQIDGLPFVDLCFNEDPEYYWCPSDVHHFEPQQIELNEAREQAAAHRRIAVAKLIASEGLFKKEEKQKLLDGNVGVLIEAVGAIGPERLRELSHHIPQDLPLWTNLIRDDAREITGIGKNQAGQTAGGRKTATEVNKVQQAFDVRTGMRRDRVAESLQKLMRKVFQICYKMWSTEKVAQIVGVEGAMHWVKLKGSDIQGEYDIKVDIENTLPANKSTRKQEIIQLIQAAGAIENPQLMQTLVAALFREFDWLHISNMLPQAQGQGQGQGQAVPFNQFQQQQRSLRNNPSELSQRQQSTAGKIPIDRLLSGTGVGG